MACANDDFIPHAIFILMSHAAPATVRKSLFISNHLPSSCTYFYNP